MDYIEGRWFIKSKTPILISKIALKSFYHFISRHLFLIHFLWTTYKKEFLYIKNSNYSVTLYFIIDPSSRKIIPRLSRCSSLIWRENVGLKSCCSELVPLLLVSSVNFFFLFPCVFKGFSLLLQYFDFKLVFLKFMFFPNKFDILSPIFRIYSHPCGYFSLCNIFFILEHSVMDLKFLYVLM